MVLHQMTRNWSRGALVAGLEGGLCCVGSVLSSAFAVAVMAQHHCHTACLAPWFELSSCCEMMNVLETILRSTSPSVLELE